MYKKTILLIIVLLTVAVRAQDSYGDDVIVGRDILDKCGMKGITIQDVATIENGRVVSLNLNNKDFSKDGFDKLPSEIGKLRALRSLSCKDNIITKIPPEIGNLTQLEKLDLSSNRIDSIPPQIGNLINLTDLDLRHNQLKVLPPELCDLEKLVYLRLWGNKLTSIPESITKLTSLRELYLKDNFLTTLPLGITTMALTYYDIIGNKLCKIDPKLEAWLIKKDKLYKQTQKCW